MYSPTVSGQQTSSAQTASTNPSSTSTNPSTATTNSANYTQADYYSNYPNTYSTNPNYHQFQHPQQVVNSHLLHDQNQSNDLAYPSNLNGNLLFITSNISHILVIKLFTRETLKITVIS